MMEPRQGSTRNTTTRQLGKRPKGFPDPLALFRKHYCEDCHNKRGQPCINEVKCIILTLTTAINDLPAGLATELWELEVQKRRLR